MNIDFTSWGLTGAVAVGLILQVLKTVWLGSDGEAVIKDRWAVVASIGIGLAISVAVYFAGLYEGVATVLNIIGAGLLAGLAACGLYSGAKKR